MKRAALFFVPALLLLLAWLVLELAGARDGLGVLSGTAVADDELVVLALAYLVSWLGLVLGAPVLALAGCWQLLASRRRGIIDRGR